MLQDPLKLPDAYAVSETPTNVGVITFALIGESDAGRSVRTGTVAGLAAKLVISRSKTKESKPYGTNRVNTRLELNAQDDNGRLVTGFVQVTVGMPQTPVISQSAHDQVRRMLLGWLLMGTPDDSNAIFLASGDGLNARLQAGEQ